MDRLTINGPGGAEATGIVMLAAALKGGRSMEVIHQPGNGSQYTYTIVPPQVLPDVCGPALLITCRLGEDGPRGFMFVRMGIRDRPVRRRVIVKCMSPRPIQVGDVDAITTFLERLSRAMIADEHDTADGGEGGG